MLLSIRKQNQTQPQLLYHMLAVQERQLRKEGKTISEGALKLPKVVRLLQMPFTNSLALTD